MQSQAITEFGKPLQLVETPTPTPTGTEVLLKVHNAGVCHSDVHIHDGYFDMGGGTKLPMANMKLPHTLGHEIEGEVVAVGPDVKDVKVGQRYAAFPVDRLRQVPVVPARRGKPLRRRSAPARLLQRRAPADMRRTAWCRIRNISSTTARPIRRSARPICARASPPTPR